MSDNRNIPIDFTEIPSSQGGSDDPDQWERFAEEFLNALEFNILKGWNRGPDQGVDLLVEDVSGELGAPRQEWVVSCKHYAHSGNTVGVSDEEDPRGRVAMEGADGFLGFYSTGPSSGLQQKFEKTRRSHPNGGLNYEFWKENILRRKLAADNRLRGVFQRFLTESFIDFFGGQSPEQNVSAMLLVGNWNTAFEGDKDAIDQLINKSPTEYEQLLKHWRNSDVFDLQKTDTVWRWTNFRQAWSELEGALSNLNLDKFEELAVDILTDIHPKYSSDAPRDYNFQATAKDKRFSADIQRGVVFTLWVISVDYKAQYAGRASKILRNTLKPDNWRVWATLGPNLKLIAEAQPDVFLDLVERGLSEKNSGIIRLFEETNRRHESVHTDLIKALQVLSWSDRHVSRVIGILTSLAKKAPETNWLPSPKGTIQRILRGVYPKCNKSAEERLKLIQVVERFAPDLASQLRTKMMRIRGVFGDTYPEPTREDWDVDPEALKEEETVPLEPYFTGLAEQILKDVERKPERLAHLLPLGSETLLDELLRPKLSKLLRTNDFEKRLTDVPNKKDIAFELRKILHKWADRSDEFWQLIEETYDNLKPKNVEDRASWLFASNIKHPDGYLRPHTKEEKRADKLRQTAIEAIEALDKPYKKFKEIARESESPFIAGRALAKHGSDLELAELIEILDATDLRTEIIRGFGKGVQVSEGDDSLQQLYADLKCDYGAEIVGPVISNLELNEDSLSFLEQTPESHQKSFWEHFFYPKLDFGDSDLVCTVAEKLESVGRFSDALQVVYFGTSEQGVGEDKISPEFLAERLELPLRFPDKDFREVFSNSVHQIEELHRDLLSAEDLEDARIAKIEFIYYGILKDQDDLLLFRTLSSDPIFFTELVSILDSDQQSEKNGKETSSIESVALKILYFDWNGYPGDHLEENRAIGEYAVSWAECALERFESGEFSTAGESIVGRALGRTPVDEDGIWPLKEIREFLEVRMSPSLRSGLESGLISSRGVHYGTGGEQERELADEFSDWANQLPDSYPQTRVALENLSKTFEAQARREQEWQNSFEEQRGEGL